MRSPFHWLYCTYALLLFIVSMFLVLPFIAVFSVRGGKRGGDNIYRACYYWDRIWLFGVGIRHENILESAPDPSRQYIFIANHISYLDIPMIFVTIRRHAIRILGKVELARVPVFGYIYKNAVVMVDRSSARQRAGSVRALKEVLAGGNSIFIFPEGTFNETGLALKDFYDGAFRIAIETGTDLQPVIFLGTFERMHYSSIFRLNPGRTRSIILPAISVNGLTMADLPALKASAARSMEEALVRHRAEWIKR